MRQLVLGSWLSRYLPRYGLREVGRILALRLRFRGFHRCNQTEIAIENLDQLVEFTWFSFVTCGKP